jgi:hypothetical protein
MNALSSVKSSTWVTLFFLFFGSLLLHHLLVPLGIKDGSHESVLFKPAVDLVEGKMVYRDSFCQYGPSGVLLEALAISLFGKYLYVVKEEVVLLYALTSIFLWFAWLQIGPRWLATVSVVLWNLLTYHFMHVFLSWPSSFALFFQSISVCFFLVGIKQDLRRYLFWSGLATGWVFFSKQNVGAYMLFAQIIGLALIGRKKNNLISSGLRSILFLCLGFATTLSAFLIWFWSKGALGDWWLQNIVWPREWARIVGMSYDLRAIYERLFLVAEYNSPPIRTDLFFKLLPLAHIIGFFTFINILRKNPTKRGAMILCFILVGLASWLQFWPVPGIGHVWWGGAPMFGVTLLLFYEGILFLCKKYGKSETFAIRALLILILLLTVSDFRHRFWVMRHRVLEPSMLMTEENPFKKLYLHPAGVEAYTRFANDLKKVSEPEKLVNAVLYNNMDGILLTFIKGHKPFHPLWASAYEWVSHSVYPGFQKQYDEYIFREKPFIITYIDEAFIEKLNDPAAKKDDVDKITKEIIKKYPGYKKINPPDAIIAIYEYQKKK